MAAVPDPLTAPHPDRLGVATESPPGDWFAIWTRSRHEQVVRDQLERKQVKAFLPTITRWSRWKDRRKKIAWPLFPGYCFARFDPEFRLAILKCTGVCAGKARSRGTRGRDVIFETLFETLWVSNPIRPRTAASRNRVMRGPGVTQGAKRSQGARRPRN